MNTRNRCLLSLGALTLAFLLSACASKQVPSRSGWVSLFNGQDLSGWEVQCQAADRNKEFWKVDQGTILCDSMGRKNHNYVWLMTRGEFSDFELRLKFQAYRDSPGNSGLQFRSRFDPALEGGTLNGPQVDIHPPAAESWRTGLVYDETREEHRWVFPSLKDWRIGPEFQPAHYVFKYADDGDGWNELVLRCQGMKIKTTLNGVVRTDWDATEVLDNEAHQKRNVGRTGQFALQLHSGDELKIRFKDILLRPL